MSVIINTFKIGIHDLSICGLWMNLKTTRIYCLIKFDIMWYYVPYLEAVWQCATQTNGWDSIEIWINLTLLPITTISVFTLTRKRVFNNYSPKKELLLLSYYLVSYAIVPCIWISPHQFGCTVHSHGTCVSRWCTGHQGDSLCNRHQWIRDDMGRMWNSPVNKNKQTKNQTDKFV